MHQSQPDSVVFLDFSEKDFDLPVIISPSKPNRSFWRNVYKVTLDDLASLVAPQRVVICEGNRDANVRGFDANCYNELFADESPETLFVSQGASSQVIRSENLIAILEALQRVLRLFGLLIGTT